MARAGARSIPIVAALVAAGAVTGASRAAPAGNPCKAWDVEYALSANLRLTDTPMGAGDGVYTVGPGKLVLRLGGDGPAQTIDVKMMSYEMRESFVVRTTTLFWTTTVTTDTRTRAGDSPCAPVAEGTLSGATLAWTTPLRAYRTDGTLACDGSLCGKFGAPPPGKSELHIGPDGVPFAALSFAKDMQTFVMPSTRVSHTDMPKQTAYLTLAGREMSRSCARADVCR